MFVAVAMEVDVDVGLLLLLVMADQMRMPPLRYAAAADAVQFLAIAS
jgi:hypothetical protein